MEQAQIAVLPPPSEAAPPLDARGERVLIVDDNAINRRVLQGMLRREPVALLTAADGEEALQIARRAPPNLILLDIMMPAKDGYQVCAELKADPRTEHVPVIFLSALSETADKIKGLELGAVDYITKPFDQGEVLARVRSQLKIQRLADEIRRANRELQDKQAHIEEDLKAAAAIQRSLVPQQAPPLAGLTLAWRFIPCDRVGGDLFHFVPLPYGQLAVYVLDVSGHGVPAAMVTVSLSQYLSPQARHLADPHGVAHAPGAVLEQLDREYPMERFDKYFTIAYALIDPARGRLRYSLGGHPQPLVVRADGRVELLEAGGALIGLGAPLPFEEGELALARGDRVFLFTDGIAECENRAGALFGEARLHAALRRGGRTLDEACDGVIEALHGFAAGADSQDDITLVGLEYAGAA
ncbi:MAG: SpoIIE family protein phosphatase [Deltaproteobacteria bacterium]|nr:SpoIIE family protein phosphatase [Deltaproteobacteria bacterium]